MYNEDELLPLSGLQHYAYCPRRAALIHVEQAWEDNKFTAEGRDLHQKAHLPSTESRGDIRIVRSLVVRSLELGLSGKLDVVEFHRIPEGGSCDAHMADGLAEAVPLGSVRGLWRPFPVEYKRGRLRREEGFEIQLCAQALCLEEMLGARVSAGAIYYGATARRLRVECDAGLRQRTQAVAASFRDLVTNGRTPDAVYGKKCLKCSLHPVCMPKAAVRSARRYVSESILRSGGDLQ